MVTHNKELLMAFVYFDQSHCGYLLERDLEEILYTLGLHLSRAQVSSGAAAPRPAVRPSKRSNDKILLVVCLPDQEAVKQTSGQGVVLLPQTDRQREG